MDFRENSKQEVINHSAKWLKGDTYGTTEVGFFDNQLIIKEISNLLQTRRKFANPVIDIVCLLPRLATSVPNWLRICISTASRNTSGLCCRLGVKYDDKKNQVRGEEVVISADDSKVKVVVIPTDEELMIATDTMALVK